jgi:phosphoribosylaminoimidazole carboxylase PurE protein
MVAAATTLPVVGVPVGITKLAGLDALLSIVQMPAGVPVATVAIDNARNGGLLAARILALSDPALSQRVADLQRAMADEVRAADARVSKANT